MKSVAIGLLLLSCFVQNPQEKKASEPGDGEAKTEKKKVVKTDKEWQKILTKQQFLVTRLKGTEPPFTGKYVNNHAKGTYHCVCCEEPLFRSAAKFESGTGWPSFYQPIGKGQVTQEVDTSMASEVRIEVNCATCGAHLGHVFNDGPEPTGLRFCINSVSLKFAKDEPKPAAKTATKSAAKTATKPAAAKPDADPARESPKPDAEAKKTP